MFKLISKLTAPIDLNGDALVRELRYQVFKETSGIVTTGTAVEERLVAVVLSIGVYGWSEGDSFAFPAPTSLVADNALTNDSTWLLTSQWLVGKVP
ncbi:hypothetical protein ElyMa_004295300 [Elysia marginata]|uniref:Uncharacterized protein n=1 Tax=Elysia marginata TaxID=1093978 RepID=A0AAV4GZK7_9GAST|nr:hypothetical protein ElyMa_004295300 [Elysia marginata]